MKNFGFATIIAGALTAGVLGFAAPAALAAAGPVSSTTISADSSHHAFIDEIAPVVSVPQVDTSVHQSR